MSSEVTPPEAPPVPPEGPKGYVWAGCVNAVRGEDHFPDSKCRWVHIKDKEKLDAG